MNIRQYNTLDSTNNECKRLIEKNRSILDTPFVVWSETQTNGRGSQNRHWYSNSKEGLYYSFCYAPTTFYFHDITRFNRSIADIIMDTIGVITGLNTVFKSPNDILLHTKKIAGILIEMNAPTASKIPQFIIIGIGLNINHQKFPDDLSEMATSLRLESLQKYKKSDFITQLSHTLNDII